MPIARPRARQRYRGRSRRATYLACVGLANESGVFGGGDAFWAEPEAFDVRMGRNAGRAGRGGCGGRRKGVVRDGRRRGRGRCRFHL